jgi:imidazolonepropionase-like amidohydrolase
MRTIFLTVAILAASVPALAQPTAFVGGRVIDGTGRVIEAGTVIIDAGKIVAAGPFASTPVPAGATRVDVKGKTLMPGLVNAHGHVADTVGLRTDAASYTRENVLRQLKTYAQYGVTTVFSLGGEQAPAFEARDEQSRGSIDRARVFVSGPVITGDTAEAARANANNAADMKPDLLKIRVDDNLGTTRKMPEAAWRATIEQAHARGLPIAVHVYSLADAKATLAAGADFIAHSVRDLPVDEAFINGLKSRDVCYCPTLTREISTFIYDATPSWVDDPFFLKGVDKDIPAQLKDPKRHEQIRNSNAWKAGQQYKAGLEVAKRNLKALSDKGVRIAMGTDTGPPARFQGFFEHLELEMMVDSGLTPMQAIVSATGDAARCYKKNGELGTLAAGSAADLLILGANPLDNIRNTRTIEQVWISGKRAF